MKKVLRSRNVAFAIVMLIAVAVGGAWLIYRTLDSPPEAEIVQYNAIVEQARAAHSRDTQTPGWDLVDEQADALYLAAVDDVACRLEGEARQDRIDKAAQQALSYGLKTTVLGDDLQAAIADCRPAFAKIRLASRTRTVRNPIDIWSSINKEDHIWFARIGRMMVADALDRRDWASLFAVARMGQDLQRNGALVGAALGIGIIDDTMLRLRSAFENHRVATQDHSKIAAELRYLAASDPPFSAFWYTEAADTVCGEWKGYGAKQLPHCEPIITGIKSWVMRGQGHAAILDAWKQRMGYEDVAEKGWPERSRWWLNAPVRSKQLSMPISQIVADVSPFGKFDGFNMTKKSLIAILRVAVGEQDVIDPMTNEPFLVTRTNGATTIASKAVGDEELLFWDVVNESDKLKMEIPATRSGQADSTEKPKAK